MLFLHGITPVMLSLFHWWSECLANPRHWNGETYTYNGIVCDVHFRNHIRDQLPGTRRRNCMAALNMELRMNKSPSIDCDTLDVPLTVDFLLKIWVRRCLTGFAVQER